MSSLTPQLIDQWSDVRWRLNNLYHIVDEQGRDVPFRMNWAQEQLFEEMHFLNVVLKARQLGFTTFIQIYMLDACFFHPNTHAGVVAHNREDAEAFFKTKIRYPYDHMDEALKAKNPATQESARELVFANGSSIRVGTSLRSGTFQYLHVSEYGKLAAKYPDRAREVKTGAFNTVHPGQFIFVESTAEGQSGEFYDLVRRAREHEEKRRELTEMDFKFHFFPWWRHPGYVSPPFDWPVEFDSYFSALHGAGIPLTDEQKAWYARKAIQQGSDMKREFPSSPDEAFEAAIEGAYFARELTMARRDGRIGRVPWEPGLPVNTFWDLGMSDQMTIWFHQRVGRENRFIDFYSNSGEGMSHYVRTLREKPYVYGRHLGPHDLAVREIGTGESRAMTARGLGLRFEVVPRPTEKMDAIESARRILPTCAFDERNCTEGINALSSYRKDWDDKLGTWKEKPRHDWASHPADAFMTFAMGYDPSMDEGYDDDDSGWYERDHMSGRSTVTGY